MVPSSESPSAARDSGEQPCGAALSQSGLEKKLFFVGLISAAAVLAVIAAPMISGETYFSRDLANYHIPMRAFYARCLAEGDSFTWCPDIFCGYYLHGEGQVGMYHPLHLLLYSTLPLVTAFNLEIFLSYPFMLVGMYLFLWRWQIRCDAALFGAILFTFSGFNLLHFTHMNAVAIVSHIPWMLFAIDVLVKGRSACVRAGALAGLAVLTGSELLLGYPQAVMFSMVAEGGYLVMLSGRRPQWRLILLFLAAKGVGVGMGAVQLLPMIDAFEGSTRVDTNFGARMVYSLGRPDFVQLVGPYLFTDRALNGSALEDGLYAGAAVPVLLAWLAVSLGRLSLNRLGPKRPLALGAILLMLVALDAACGPNGILGSWLARVPLINLFRVPGRYILLVHLAMAVACAIALDAMLRAAEERKKTEWRRLWPIAIPAVVAVAAAVLALWPWENAGTWLSIFAAHAVRNPYLILAGPALAVTAAILVGAASRGAVLALAGIIVFAAGDQAIYGLSYVWDGPVETLPAFVSSVDMPPEAGAMRVTASDSGETPGLPLRAHRVIGLWLLGGYKTVNGYVGLPPKRGLRYSSIPVLRLAQAKWRWSPVGPDAGDREPFGWFEVPDPLPRARLVSKTVAWKAVDAKLSGVDVDSTAVVEGDVNLPDSAPGEATITVDRPGHIVVSVSASARQILVVSESFHAGWRATSDGVGIEVIPVYHDFLGCVVEPGKHVIDLTFKPASLAAGMWVSIIALVALLSFVFVAARRA